MSLRSFLTNLWARIRPTAEAAEQELEAEATELAQFAADQALQTLKSKDQNLNQKLTPKK